MTQLRIPMQSFVIRFGNLFAFYIIQAVHVRLATSAQYLRAMLTLHRLKLEMARQ